MCVFCAAIPAALAVGVKAQAQQRKQLISAEEKGESPPRPKLSAKTATGIVVAGLAVGSIVYHTSLRG